MAKSIKISLVILIILLAAILRLSFLNKYPPSLFSDEVDLGYQAYSFLKTGKDYFGNAWPISFHSFADFRASVYIYSAVAGIRAFGLNEWGVRLPAALYGILGIAVFYLLVKKLTANYWFSILAALVLTILPWHLHYSRAGFEVTALFFFLCLGLYFLFSYLKSKSVLSLTLALIALILCFYTYATARLFLPLLALATLVLYGKDLFSVSWKKLVPCFFICLVVIAPFLQDTFLGGGLRRFSYINIFSDPNLKFEINRQRLVDATHNKEQVVGMTTSPAAKIFHSKPLSWVTEIGHSYVSSLSFNFLVLTGDPNYRHGLHGSGGLLLAFLPFLVLGLFRLALIIKNDEGEIFTRGQSLFFLIFCLLAPIPSSITFDGGVHSTRLFFLVLPLSVFIALGLWTFFAWIKNSKTRVVIISLTVMLIGLNFINYLHNYYYHYPLESEKYWHAGLKEAVFKVTASEKNYSQIFITDRYEPPLVFFLFWSKYDPAKWNFSQTEWLSEEWFEGRKFNNYYFGRLNANLWTKYLPGLKMTQGDKVLIVAGQYDFGGDLETGTPAGLSLIEKILLPVSRKPVLYFFEYTVNDKMVLSNK